MQGGIGPVCRLTLGTALLGQLAVAVRAVQDRLQLEPDRKEARAQESDLGVSYCIRCLSARCVSPGLPPRLLRCRIGSSSNLTGDEPRQLLMQTLSLGTGLLDGLAAAVEPWQNHDANADPRRGAL